MAKSYQQTARYYCYKQFGLGAAHYMYLCLKATTRLHFLKVLKRSTASSDDLVHYYKSTIRPVIESACPA
jgi:Domain of unknown function (DUF1891)